MFCGLNLILKFMGNRFEKNKTSSMIRKPIVDQN